MPDPHILFRASSLGRLMTAPTAAAAKAGEVLSAGATTFVRELVAQAVLGVDFEVRSRAMDKGLRCEAEALALLNRVCGLSLDKNTERVSDGCITGECDAYDEARREGYDLKCAWSAATWPLTRQDCVDAVYEWQARAYMRLWDAPRWHVVHALIDTPEDLIGYEPQSMHFFGHLPDSHRLTIWTIERDAELERAIDAKVTAARAYYRAVLDEFERSRPGPARPTAGAQASINQFDWQRTGVPNE